MVMVKKMQDSGVVINYSFIIAVVTGIMANDRTLLKERGGTMELGKSFVNQCLNE